jgi:hypothetical protein
MEKYENAATRVKVTIRAMPMPNRSFLLRFMKGTQDS